MLEIGQKIGKLTAVKKINRPGRARFLFLCECSETLEADSSNVEFGKTKSCGCVRKQKAAEQGAKNTTHKMKGSRIYNIYNSMKQRCDNPNSCNYESYGGRGIKVCKEWRDFKTFLEWAIINGYKDTLTLDRKDNYKGYGPSNCRWATFSRQRRNQRNAYTEKEVHNIMAMIFEGKSINKASIETGIPYSTARQWVKKHRANDHTESFSERTKGGVV